MYIFHSMFQMGNQMFIYACARSLSKTQKTGYCISRLGKLKYFELSSNEILFNFFKYNLFRLQNLLHLTKYKFNHFQDIRKDYYSELINSNYKNIWFYGFFQSEKYFSNNSDEIKKCFKVTEKYIKEFKNKYENIFKNNKVIVVHIRRKDYNDFGYDFLGSNDLRLPMEYYKKIISRYNQNDYKIIFISDEIDFVENEFKYLENAIFSHEKDIIDFQLLQNANICILSNSSFSWWGAWLNSNKNKVVYVPEYFLGFKVNQEYPINIIPDNWIKVSVNN